jgi:hypothetical protein
MICIGRLFFQPELPHDIPRRLAVVHCLRVRVPHHHSHAEPLLPAKKSQPRATVRKHTCCSLDLTLQQ